VVTILVVCSFYFGKAKVATAETVCVFEVRFVVHSQEPFNSLASLNESDESTTESSSPTTEKIVRFSDCVKRQLYRSNSSILGQRKKNQKRSKNKRKSRERSVSEGSVSSADCDNFNYKD